MSSLTEGSKDGEPVCKKPRLFFDGTGNSPKSEEQELNEGTQEYELDGESATIPVTSDTGLPSENGHVSDGQIATGSGMSDDAVVKVGARDIEPHRLNKIESVHRDALAVSGIIPHVDFDEIYNKILKLRNEKNRVELVANNVLEKGTGETNVTATKDVAPADDIFEDVMKILKENPSADPNIVYNHLENLKGDSKRVDKVIAILREKSKGVTDSVSASVNSTFTDMDASLGDKKNPFDDPDFKKNPLYRDLKTLLKVLPAVNPNELYAYLEAYYDKPNRVQIVIDELTKSDSQESLPLTTEPSLEDLSRGKGPVSTECRLQADLKELKDIFRDCDPNFLYEKLTMMTEDSERVHKIAAELFEKTDYPKLNEGEDKKKDVEKRRITDMNFDMVTFLMKFPDPKTYFHNIARDVSQSYKDHVMVYMKNTYPQLKAGYIKKVLSDKNHCLVPTVLEIEAYLPNIRGKVYCNYIILN